jgi:hypothetical protein
MDSYLRDIKQTLPKDVLYTISRFYRIKFRREYPCVKSQAITSEGEILRTRDNCLVSHAFPYQCYTIGPNDYIVFCMQNNYMRCIYLREKPQQYRWNHLELVYKSPFYISVDTNDVVILSPLNPNTSVHFTYRPIIHACLILFARHGFTITGDTLIHINNKNTHPIRDVFAKIVSVRDFLYGTNDVWDVNDKNNSRPTKSFQCIIS